MNYHINQVGNTFYLARAGGGGSSSSGGSHSSSSSRSSSSSYSRSSGSSGGVDGPWYWTVFFILLFAGLPLLFVFIVLRASKKKMGNFSTVPAGYIDPVKDGSDEEKKLAVRSREVFLAFQSAWSEYDLVAIKKFTSNNFYKKMVLELNVLKNYDRQNKMENVNVTSVHLLKSNDYSKGFSMYIVASSKDSLIDNKQNKTIYTDNSNFSEIWHFVKTKNQYVLDKIDQTTADASKFNIAIAEFASKNNFYYDPDFGWLMMPSRGAIFGPTGFGNADINNHVIGYYKDIIVEFYSYEPKAGAGIKPFVVAQAILPKSYDDILVTEKSWYSFKPKAKGLNKIETESVEFNKKFVVWAANTDQAASFELLATNFMERIYALEFEINIEVVDNVLYLYSPDTKIAYSDMLEVLTWAFKEMKM